MSTTIGTMLSSAVFHLALTIITFPWSYMISITVSNSWGSISSGRILFTVDLTFNKDRMAVELEAVLLASL